MTALPIDLIDIRTDARAVDETAVAGLAESIADVGLINPIRVRANGDRWEVIAGVHRLQAHRQLGLAEIEAIIVTDDDLHAELAMIDENLCRSELSPIEKAQHIARRKVIYETIHGKNAFGPLSQKLPKSERPERFTSATAKLSGESERNVQLNWERGRKIIDEAADLIKGTKLDTTTYLDKIKGLSPNDQVTAVKRDLAFQRSQERNAIARRYQKPAVDVEDVNEKQFDALMSAWNKAGEIARDRFLAAIDTPVMDRSAA